MQCLLSIVMPSAMVRSSMVELVNNPSPFLVLPIALDKAVWCRSASGFALSHAE